MYRAALAANSGWLSKIALSLLLSIVADLSEADTSRITTPPDIAGSKPVPATVKFSVESLGTPDLGGDLTPIQTTADTSINAAGNLLDINTASAAELAAVLPGIGPSKADNIVEWRDINGPFETVEQLLEVSGIGPVTLEKIRPFIFIGNASGATRSSATTPFSLTVPVPGIEKAKERRLADRLGNIVRLIVNDREQAINAAQ